MTPPFTQVSILDYPQITAGAHYVVPHVTADSLARSADRMAERAFDDLDYFDIFALKCGDIVLGFRTYHGAPDFSAVSVWPRDASGAIDLIAAIAAIVPEEIQVFAEPM